jgi:hypothetical protein
MSVRPKFPLRMTDHEIPRLPVFRDSTFQAADPSRWRRRRLQEPGADCAAVRLRPCGGFQRPASRGVAGSVVPGADPPQALPAKAEPAPADAQRQPVRSADQPGGCWPWSFHQAFRNRRVIQ